MNEPIFSASGVAVENRVVRPVREARQARVVLFDPLCQLGILGSPHVVSVLAMGDNFVRVPLVERNLALIRDSPDGSRQFPTMVARKALAPLIPPDSLLDAGNVDGTAVWRRIIGAEKEFQGTAPATKPQEPLTS